MLPERPSLHLHSSGGEDDTAAERQCCTLAAIWSAKPQKLEGPQTLGRTFHVLEPHLLAPWPLTHTGPLPPALQSAPPRAPLPGRRRATFSPTTAQLLPYIALNGNQAAFSKREQQTGEARSFPRR